MSQNKTDRQVEYEREIMGMDKHNDDWFYSDEELEAISEKEYRMYEMDCIEVLDQYVD